MKNSETNNIQSHSGNTVLCDGFLIPMTDFVLRINEIEKEIDQFFDSWRMKQLRIIENYAKLLKQPLKLEMFVPCVNGEPIEFHEGKVLSIAKVGSELLKEAKEKVLFEGFKIYDYKLNVFFYLGRKKILSYDKKRKDFITIGFLPEKVEDLINVSSQIKLSQTALDEIFG